MRRKAKKELPMPQGLLFFFCTTMMLFLAQTFSSIPVVANDNLRVSALKAAFVYNFAKFTEWPNAAHHLSPNIHFCFSPGSVDRNVRKSLASKVVNGRPIEFHEVDKDFSSCHVIYVSKDAKNGLLKEAIAWGTRHPVLLVSDIRGFAHLGGHIELYIDSGKLRFRVNLAAVRKSNLKLSSKLLQLADVVSGNE